MWTHIAYTKRLDYERRSATTPKGMARLKATLRDVETHLSATWHDPLVDDWIALLRQYETAATHVGRRFGSSTKEETGG